MQTLAHVQYGWALANSDKKFDLKERSLITLAALAPDIDSLAIIFGKQAFYDYHHILLHNFLTLVIYTLIALAFTRKLKVIVMVVLSFGIHLATDYITSDWDLLLFYPFSNFAINLQTYLSRETIIYILQPIFAYGIIPVTLTILIKYKRTFIEVISKKLDIILVNFITLPWKHKCDFCSNRALYKCSKCGKYLCSNHRQFKNLEVFCKPFEEQSLKKISKKNETKIEDRP